MVRVRNSTNTMIGKRATAVHWLIRITLLLIVALTSTMGAAGPAQSVESLQQRASAPRDAIDEEFTRLINGARASAGLAPVIAAPGLRNLSIWWSSQLADGATNCRLEHNPNAWQQLPQYGASNRTTWGENVAMWSTDRYSPQSIFDHYMASPGHRANILGANFRFVGVGTVSATSSCAGNDFNTMTFTDKVDAGSSGEPASGRIALRAAVNNRFVVAEGAGANSLIANRSAAGQWEAFDVVDRGGADVALRSNANGRYVCAESAGNVALIANRASIGAWETFERIDNGDGTVSLRSRSNGRFVTAESAGNAPLVATRTAIGLWEKFTIVPQ
jgi:uncharacterized protein YkwD